jgi:DNA-binding transcriptional LysR family regulator
MLRFVGCNPYSIESFVDAGARGGRGRAGVSPISPWPDSTEEVVAPLKPRLLMDDMLSLKQAAVSGIGVVALPGYVCRDEVKSGALQRILPSLIGGDSTLTALMPYRQGLLPSVHAFVEHLAVGLPNAVLLN